MRHYGGYIELCLHSMLMSLLLSSIFRALLPVFLLKPPSELKPLGVLIRNEDGPFWCSTSLVGKYWFRPFQTKHDSIPSLDVIHIVNPQKKFPVFDKLFDLLSSSIEVFRRLIRPGVTGSYKLCADSGWGFGICALAAFLNVSPGDDMPQRTFTKLGWVTLQIAHVDNARTPLGERRV